MSDFDSTRSTEIAVDRRDQGHERLCLVLAWSAEQPELAGHCASAVSPAMLGRGAAQKGDPAPRLHFLALRPDHSLETPPLLGAQLSRSQLLIEPAGEGALALKSIGRAPLLLNGEPATQGTVRPGDTLCIGSTLVFLVVARPTRWLDTHRHWKNLPHAFGTPDPHGILGESPAIWKLRDALLFAAQSPQHVLVQGESGSGKELIARALHTLSPRRAAPFVARNAATLPEGLADAELFGTVRGYPHEGSPERPGLIGTADRGTLFLDELAELPHDLQSHLLRVLDDHGDYHRLGDARPRKADVRVVAATNRPIESLKHDVAARFTLRLSVPGLNDRREDIPLLLRQLFARAVGSHPGLAAVHGQKDAVQLSTALDPALVEALLRHRYTHHLRELHQLLWLALSTSPTGRADLTREVRAELGRAEMGRARGAEGAAAAGAGTVAGAGEMSAYVAERRSIEAALLRTGGKVAPAARLLGLKTRHVLYRMMEKHGIRRAAGQDEGAEE